MKAMIVPKAGRGRKKHQGEAEPVAPLRRGVCDYCGESHKKRGRFCSPPCRAGYWRVARMRGGKIYPMLIRWRLWRGRVGTPGEGQLGLVAAEVDSWIQSDRAPHPPTTAKKKDVF